MSDAEASESSELPVALSQYSTRLADALGGVSPASLEQLARDISAAWSAGRQVFIRGNGGSAANAIHLIHVAIDDMQIAEDAQMAVGHALMQVLQGAGGPRAGAHG